MRLLVAAAIGSLLPAWFEGGGARPARTVGAETCKLCHRSTYLAWEKTPHRRATDVLSEADRDAACLRCHATGPERLPGVQCEACHGPGGGYWPASVMIDPSKARAAGLVDPTPAVCSRCHGQAQTPGHRPGFEMPLGEELRRTVH